MEQNKDVFLTFLESHKGIIYKVANAYCKDVHQREDVIQEIIIQLWTSFENYNSQYQASTWVYRIALNTAISFYRKTRRHQNNTRSLSPIIEYFQAADHPHQEDPNLQLLTQFIGQLGEIDKSLILLYLDGHKYQEIAEVTGFTTTNVSTRISRIKAELKRKFEKLKP